MEREETILALALVAILGFGGLALYLRGKVPHGQPGDIYTPPPPDPDPYPRPTNGVPPGTVIWTGPVPQKMIDFATEVLKGPYPMHSTLERSFPDGPVVAAVQWHLWTRRTGVYETFPDGIRGVTLFRKASP